MFLDPGGELEAMTTIEHELMHNVGWKKNQAT